MEQPAGPGQVHLHGAGGVNMLSTTVGVHRRVAEWDTALPPPFAARMAGGLSILLWTAIVFFGR